MKTKTLRLPVLFASAGAILCTVSVVRAADASLEVRQDQSSTQKEVINEPSGADRSYSTRIETGPAYGTSGYSSQTYESGAALDPDAENDRLLHMYQRGRAAAESLDNQVRANPVVVLPGSMATESFRTSQTFQHPSELHQQQYSSSFNEPAAAERESTSSSSSTTTRRYSTSENATGTQSSTATLSSGSTIRASDLIGMNINNDQGQRIGEVKDVVLDMKSGRVAYAVVSAENKWLAVPPTVFTRTGTSKTLTWNIDNDKLRTAPTIDKSNWNAALQQDYIGNVYNFYGVQGYKAESEVSEPAGSQKNLQFHHDSEHQEQQEQRQDKDQSRNDASRSDVSGQSAGAATQSSEQSDLQKSQPEKSASSADVSKEAAGAQPSASGAYSSGQSSSSSSQPQSSSSSSSSELKSSTDVNAPAGAQSSSSSSAQDANADKQSSSSEKQNQSSSSSSSSGLNESAGATTTTPSTSAETSSSSGDLKDRVQMALKNDASLSTSAENVSFSMDNDKLVIKGTVKSQDEKNRILEKVRATAGSTEIDDQLKVSSSSDSDSDSSKDNDASSSSDNK